MKQMTWVQTIPSSLYPSYFSLILFHTVKLDIIIQQEGLRVNMSKACKQIGGLIISAEDQSLARRSYH